VRTKRKTKESTKEEKRKKEENKRRVEKGRRKFPLGRIRKVEKKRLLAKRGREECRKTKRGLREAMSIREE
jgi:hypothetical protein